ncbi:MAG: hypothetical protein U0931_35730 [Vulcanimicrobiota bacterium]
MFSRRRGFSLAEALLASLLTGLLLLLLSSALTQFLRTQNKIREQDHSSQTTSTLLSDMRVDVLGASQVLQTSPHFRLRLPPAQDGVRVPLEFPAAPPAAFDPQAQTYLVDYWLDGPQKRLVRGVTAPDGSLSEQTVISPVTEFSVTNTTSRCFNVRLTVQEPANLQHYLVSLWRRVES